MQGDPAGHWQLGRMREPGRNVVAGRSCGSRSVAPFDPLASGSPLFPPLRPWDKADRPIPRALIREVERRTRLETGSEVCHEVPPVWPRRALAGEDHRAFNVRRSMEESDGSSRPGACSPGYTFSHDSSRLKTATFTHS